MPDVDMMDQPVAETPPVSEEVRTSPAPEQAPAPEPEPTPEPEKPHPLEPGGERFKQVVARAHTAESKLQTEREERIRLEERLKAQTEAKEKDAAKQAAVPWRAYEAAIAEGRLDKAQAMELWAQQREQARERDTMEKFEKKLQQTQRDTMLLADIGRYQQALPSVMQTGTEERSKYEREYTYLTQNLGYAPGYATQLAAVKMAFGDITDVERAQRLKSTQGRGEPSMETHGTGSPQRKTTKDPVEQLTPRERAYYEGRIKRRDGYTSWDDVRKELSWVRGNGKP